MVKLRLRRMGRKKMPIYKIVAADSRAPRDGRFLEEIGHYNPNMDPMVVKVEESRALYWLNTGAQPTSTVRNLLSREGIILKWHLEKKKADSETIEKEVEKFLSQKEEKHQKAKDKKIRRKLNKNTKGTEGAAETTPAEAAPVENTEAATETTG